MDPRGIWIDLILCALWPFLELLSFAVYWLVEFIIFAVGGLDLVGATCICMVLLFAVLVIVLYVVTRYYEEEQA